MNNNFDEVEVGQVFSALGFHSKQESWKAAYDFLAEQGFKPSGVPALSGTIYDSIAAVYTDIINGGSIVVPNGISKEAVDVFFLAASHVAQYEILSTSGREWSPTETVYEVADEE